MTTLLLLANNADHSRTYMHALSRKLLEHQIESIFAIDSHLTDYTEGKGAPLPNAYYFSDHLKTAASRTSNSAINAKGAGTAQNWSIFFSDFDRFLTFGVNPMQIMNKGLHFEAIAEQLSIFFAQIMDHHKIDGIVYEPVSNSFALSAFYQASKRQIPFFSISPSRISGRMEISGTGALSDEATLANIYEDIASGRSAASEDIQIARDYIEGIDQDIPDYMKTNGLDAIHLSRKYLNFSKLRLFIRFATYLIKSNSDWTYAYQHGNPFRLSSQYILRSVRRRLRYRIVRRHLRTNAPGENYFLYPIQFHPEASSSIYAPDYVDEFNNIRSIAFRLPIDTKLVVKEHPSATGNQKVEFYKKLSWLPNVILVAPEVPIKPLIRNAIALITATSTAGFEAAVLDKPVILLGRAFYSYFPNVKLINSPHELDSAIAWARDFVGIGRDEIERHLAAYIAFGKVGQFDFRLRANDSSHLDLVAGLLSNKVKNQNVGT